MVILRIYEKKYFSLFVMFVIFVICLLSAIILSLTGGGSCSKELLESIKSPNGKYTINTYLHNCHATVDFSITAELCDKDNKCKEIYDVYHERTSFAYWIDQDNVFINGKELNIKKDTYSWNDYDDYYDNLFELYPNHDFEIYLINKNNKSKKITEEETGYIIDAMKKYKFIEDAINSNYDYKLKIIDKNKFIENNTEEFMLVINKNSIMVIQKNKIIELDRTDTEFIKRILQQKN